MRGQRGRPALGYVNSAKDFWGVSGNSGRAFPHDTIAQVIRQFRKGGLRGNPLCTVFGGYIRESWSFWMDKKKVGDIFSQILANKMAHSDHGNAVLSGKQKQQNVPAGHVFKGVAAVMNFAQWLFSKGVYKQMDFDIDISIDDESFSLHGRQKAYIGANCPKAKKT